MDREFTEVGDEYLGRHSRADAGSTPDYDQAQTRLSIVKVIDALTWRRPVGGMAMSPALLLHAIIPQTGLRAISAVALNGYLEFPDGVETATCAVLGIEGRDGTGRVRLYVLDIGNGGVPLAIDRNVSEPALPPLDGHALRAILTALPEGPDPL